MKLKLTLTQYLDLVKARFFYPDQGEILFNNFLTEKTDQLPYVTKTQLRILRKMGCVEIGSSLTCKKSHSHDKSCLN